MPNGVDNELKPEPQGSSFLATLGFGPKSLQDSKTSGGKPGGSPDDFLKITKPEQIRLLDPAVGSSHMLTYAFDLLYLIYEEEGYAAHCTAAIRRMQELDSAIRDLLSDHPVKSASSPEEDSAGCPILPPGWRRSPKKKRQHRRC